MLSSGELYLGRPFDSVRQNFSQTILKITLDKIKEMKIRAYCLLIILSITMNGFGTKEGLNPGPGGATYPGQLNYISFSNDFKTWSKPVAAFTSGGINLSAVQTRVAGYGDTSLRKARRNAFGVDFIQLKGTLGQRISYSGQAIYMLDWDNTFLAPFLARADSKVYIYIATGKNLEALIYWAAYEGTQEAVAFKNNIIGKLIASQDMDGYIGTFAPMIRGRHTSHDYHEATYIMKESEERR